MNKKILLTFVIVLAVVLSASTIYASEVNVTDSNLEMSQDDATPVSVDSSNSEVVESVVSNDSSTEVLESVVSNDSSTEVLESDNSSTLSTNEDDSNILSVDGAEIENSKTVTSKAITKYYKGSEKYTATFLDKYGKPLSKTNVTLSVNGKTYTKTTNSKGVVSLTVNLKPGTYQVVATNPSTGYKLTTTYKVLSTISASDLSKVYKDTKKFTATFRNSTGALLAYADVTFKFNGKTYTKKTNSKGVASFSVPNLKPGTYNIISYNPDGFSKTNKINVVSPASTTLKVSDYTYLTGDTKVIKVKLLNQFGYALAAGQVVKFAINGKTYTAKTDGDGIAKLTLKLAAGIYDITYKFDAIDNYKASSAKGKVTILPSKTPTFTVKSTTTFGYGAKTPFKVALTSGSVPLVGYTVVLNVNGHNYTKTTDSNGIVSLTINLKVGKYVMTYTNNATSKIKSKSESITITSKERTQTSVKWKSSTSFYQGKYNVKVLLLDSKSKAIANQNVKLTVKSKDYTAKTDSSGYATFSIDFAPGNYSVSYSYAGNNDYAPSSAKTALNVKKITSISIKNIISTATSLKNYYQKNNKYPSSVESGGLKFTVPEFLYLMSQAIVQLSSSNNKDIAYISGVTAPKSPSGDQIASKELYKNDYVSVAKNVASYIKSNKQAPNYASSAVGKIIYSELVDAFSRILAFYGANDNYMPNYVTVIYGSGVSTSQSGTGLNEKNTIKDLTAYLKSSTNCQVDNSQIKSLVNKLTKGLTTDAQKATAIFNYVRDYISYSFYYDTWHGAVGTLNAGSGNCVDQSHLLVAMFRTADLPARYVHGTCTFSSGSTYGHVWSQVLIDGKWIVADATSTRNSFGNVANWNTGSYSVHGMYSSLSF